MDVLHRGGHEATNYAMPSGEVGCLRAEPPRGNKDNA